MSCILTYMWVDPLSVRRWCWVHISWGPDCRDSIMNWLLVRRVPVRRLLEGWWGLALVLKSIGFRASCWGYFGGLTVSREACMLIRNTHEVLVSEYIVLFNRRLAFPHNTWFVFHLVGSVTILSLLARLAYVLVTVKGWLNEVSWRSIVILKDVDRVYRLL